MSDHYANGSNGSNGDALYANLGVLPETYKHSGNGHTPKRDPWRSYSEAELARMDIPEPAFDIESLLPSEEGPALFFGPPGACKSWITMHLCRCMATGAPFLGRFPTKQYRSVLFINFDAGTKTTMRRFKRLAAGKTPLTNYRLISEREFDAAELRRVFEENPGAFIAIDCLADFYRADRTKEQGEAMRDFIRDLRSLYEANGCNGVVLDHPHRPRDGQPGDFYGSVQKEATFRTMWHAQPIAPSPGEPTGVARVKIISRKINEGEKSPPFIIKVGFSSADISFAHEADPSAEEVALLARRTELIVEQKRCELDFMQLGPKAGQFAKRRTTQIHADLARIAPQLKALRVARHAEQVRRENEARFARWPHRAAVGSPSIARRFGNGT